MKNENAKKRILHVDDESDTLKVVKTILEKEGFDVISATNGQNALEKINMDGYDLIILDIMMPDMSGWDLFTRIAKIKPDYKVIFLSVLEISDEKLKEFKNSGIRDYIKKPFDRNDLIARVKKAMGI